MFRVSVAVSVAGATSAAPLAHVRGACSLVCAMVVAGRLSWLFDQLQAGRAARISFNTSTSGISLHFSLLPAGQVACDNTLGLGLVFSVMQSLDGYVAVDHGHQRSCGSSHVSLKLRPRDLSAPRDDRVSLPAASGDDQRHGEHVLPPQGDPRLEPPCAVSQQDPDELVAGLVSEASKCIRGNLPEILRSFGLTPTDDEFMQQLSRGLDDPVLRNLAAKFRDMALGFVKKSAPVDDADRQRFRDLAVSHLQQFDANLIGFLQLTFGEDPASPPSASAAFGRPSGSSAASSSRALSSDPGFGKGPRRPPKKPRR